jgi:hypothetical protein
VVGSQITDNHATLDGILSGGGGGGITLRNAGMQVDDSTISGNSGRAGGGILIRDGNYAVSIKNSHVDGNSTRGGGAGGIWRSGNMSLEIINSSVDNNVSSGRGGGMEVLGRGAFLLEDSSVSGNTANGHSFSSSAGGGGIVVESDAASFGNSLVIRRSKIADNHATFDGGGLHLNETSTLQIEDSEILGNTTNDSGGGIFGSGQYSLPAGSFPLQIRRTRIVGNGAVGGGNAVHLEGHPYGGKFGHGTAAMIESSEISGNQRIQSTYSSNFGAIYARSERLSIIDTVISGNSGTGITFKSSTATTPTLVVTNTTVAGGIISYGGAVQLTDTSVVGSAGTGVYVSGASLDIAGGAICDNGDRGIDADDGDVSVSNANISGNGNVGLYVRHGSLVVESSTISANRSTSDGGGIFCVGDAVDTLTINKSTISGNEARAGGGIFTLNDLTMTDSVVSGNRSTDERGGISTNSDLLIIRSEISNNRTTGASSYGGGIKTSGSLLEIRDSDVSNNEAMGPGGAIYTYATVQIEGSNFAGNVAGTDGGAIYAGVNAFTMLDSTVTGNCATGGAGGGIMSGSVIVIRDSSVTYNVAALSGGGIAGGNPEIVRSNIANNSSGQNGGGGIAGYNGTVSIFDSSVTNNSATGIDAHGGGVSSRTVNVTQSTISNNRTNGSSGHGGGIYAQFGLKLDQSTVANNMAMEPGSDGGGVYLGGLLSLTATVIADNTSGGINHDVRPAGPITAQATLVGDTSGWTTQQLGWFDAGIGNLRDQNALLGPLAYNGGPVFEDGTRMLTHALLSGSPAIDAGDPTVNGPVATYRFEEVTETLVAEDSAGSNDGMYHGDPLLGAAGAPRAEGTAATFDGIDDYVTIPPSITEDFSFSLWVKTSQHISGPVEILRQVAGADSIGFALYMSNGRPALLVGSTQIASNVTINDGNWHHLAVTRDATTGARAIFVDGVVRDGESATRGPLGVLGTPEEIYVGGSPDGWIRFEGTMDELLLFDQVLAATEVARLAATELPAFDQRGEPFARVADGDNVGGARIDIGAVEWQVNPLPGDYNFDGIVNAADYSVWRNTLGSTTDSRADGTSATTPGAPDGVVDELDYAFWKANFGNVLQQGAGSGEQGIIQSAGELRLAGSIGATETTVAAVATPARRSSPAVEAEDLVVQSFKLGRRTVISRHDTATVRGRTTHDDALLAWLSRRGNQHASVGGDDELEHADDTAADSAVGTLDEAFAALSGGF